MIEFALSKAMKVAVKPHQIKQISAKEKIEKMLLENKAFAFDILVDKQIVGFAMLREYEQNKHFLWNYAIDKDFQGQGLGKKCLKELIVFLKEHYACKALSTTYKMTNYTAKKLYQDLGFQETEVVEDQQEVDMLLKF